MREEEMSSVSDLDHMRSIKDGLLSEITDNSPSESFFAKRFADQTINKARLIITDDSID